MMNKTCGIYKITSPSCRVYVGQSRNIEERFGRYKRLHVSNKTQIKLSRSFAKYGVNNHTFEIIEECEIEELNIKERYWQDFYDVLNEGLNCILTPTNVLPKIVSSEYREKRSGKNHCMYNKKHSLETRQKMSEAAKGRQLSEKTKKKLSDMKKGKNNSFYGKKHKIKSRLKQSKAAKNRKIQGSEKKVNQYSLNNIFIKTWDSTSKAAIKVGIFSSGISACINGRQKTAGGFIWKHKVS